MDYRREIDGLRAVAVIPVILFHAGFESFRGGFVGVDVFFVISGYLITTIILSEKERGTFSLVDFYERRTRRILPALFLVMFVSLPFAWLWLLPSDMQTFSQSLIAVSTFSSNIFFWQTSGYWGLENELVPLLHTWSLAVEEQYYLLFPLFLMLMWRFRKRWIFSSFVLIAAASLLVAQWGAYHHPTATFFLLVTRGWELAIGASIAFYFLFRKRIVHTLLRQEYVDEALSVTGLLMIGYSVFLFDETVPFPSLYALVPTVGTGLIILFSSSKTIIGQVLGHRLLVGIGLISYSAYLWHLPLFAFARYRSLTSPNATLLLALSVLSVALAFLSWKFFEKPFRNKDLFDRKAIFTFAAIGSGFFLVVGFAGHLSDGWPQRIDKKLQSTIDAATKKASTEKFCEANDEQDDAMTESCTLVKRDKFAYLMGDSHAIAISNEMKTAFEQTTIGLIQATERGCPPVQNVYVYVSESDRWRCFKHNETAYRHVENTPDIEYIILVARWALYTERVRFNNGEGGVEREEVLHFAGVTDAELGYSKENRPNDYFAQAYVDSVKALLKTGKKVILVYPIPEAGWNVPRYIRNYYLHNPDEAFSPATGSTSYEVFRNRNRKAYRALDSIGENPNLVRIYPENMFCNSDVQKRCIVQKDDNLLYFDDDHLSKAGAMLLSQMIVSELN